MTLQTQYTLSQDATFQQRVRQAIVTAAIAISNEAPNVTGHSQRAQLAVKVLSDQGPWSQRFAEGAATDSAVAAAEVGATDAQINNAVTSQWNAYAGVGQ